jgi:hypothetical protein
MNESLTAQLQRIGDTEFVTIGDVTIAVERIVGVLWDLVDEDDGEEACAAVTMNNNTEWWLDSEQAAALRALMEEGWR